LSSEKQEHRFLLLPCHAPPQRLFSTLFATVYKRPTKGGLEAFAFCLWCLLWALAWVFLFGLLFLAFWCGKLLEGTRITEGKRMAKEKLMKGKTWLRKG
jgi:hypothetical protein